MSEYLDEINYEKLVEKALKHVIVEALKIAESQGLPNENHYYITFQTNHPKTRISDYLKSQYPKEMTIVIQHQFSNLIIKETYFSIDLSFSGVPQTLEIPYDAISYFGDPYAKFGLSFDIGEVEESPVLEARSVLDEIPSEKPLKVSGGAAEVVSIDAFRKKKK